VHHKFACENTVMNRKRYKQVVVSLETVDLKYLILWGLKIVCSCIKMSQHIGSWF
jgi:hypothetical protein